MHVSAMHCLIDGCRHGDVRCDVDTRVSGQRQHHFDVRWHPDAHIDLQTTLDFERLHGALWQQRTLRVEQHPQRTVRKTTAIALIDGSGRCCQRDNSDEHDNVRGQRAAAATASSSNTAASTVATATASAATTVRCRAQMLLLHIDLAYWRTMMQSARAVITIHANIFRRRARIESIRLIQRAQDQKSDNKNYNSHREHAKASPKRNRDKLLRLKPRLGNIGVWWQFGIRWTFQSSYFLPIA